MTSESPPRVTRANQRTTATIAATFQSATKSLEAMNHAPLQHHQFYEPPVFRSHCTCTIDAHNSSEHKSENVNLHEKCKTHYF